MSPKVSILVPCFRAARLVGHALDSILSQGETDLEVVVVDNASDDGSFDVARAYAVRDARVRVYRNDRNLGPVRNWRRCAELATGRFAGLLFADDWYEAGFVAEALALLEGDSGVGFVYSAVNLVADPDAPQQAGTDRVLYRLDGPSVLASADFLRIAYGGRGRTVPLSPGCALMRRDDLARWLSVRLPDEERLGYLDHGAGPDQAVYLQACLEYPRVGHLAEPRVTFRAHGGNLSWRRDVAVGYARMRADFYLANAGALRLGRARIPAKLAFHLRALGEEVASARLRGRLGPLGRVMYAKEALFEWRRSLRRRAAGRRT